MTWVAAGTFESGTEPGVAWPVVPEASAKRSNLPTLLASPKVRYERSRAAIAVFRMLKGKDSGRLYDLDVPSAARSE